MKVVGLTGGIGSGKSTVAKMFQDLGVPVYFSDTEAKRIMQESKEVQQGLIDLFGEKVFESGNLNRTYLARLVFNNSELLSQLNALVHPAVAFDFEKWISRQNAEIVMQESALIFENEKEDFFDAVILVTAPKELRIDRLKKRDHSSQKEIESRMNNQLSDKDKFPRADFVIENIDILETEKRVNEVLSILLST
ncbi:dephospho-CoA kinase [Namhaeicola litoreus]|uniref:Dephospho-CoA kinase n=1 Tax=Namhaeicola litoreus TaxID=1052145 RepID=A0ABW3Y7M5_9FLAO